MTAIEMLKVIDRTHDYPCPYGIGGKAWIEIRNCIEKQIPKKPDISGDSCDKDGNLIYDTYDCPNCHTSYEMEYEKYDYCPSCGQALNWSEEVNENE